MCFNRILATVWGRGEGVVERLWQQHREEVMAVKTGLVAGGSPVGQRLPLL